MMTEQPTRYGIASCALFGVAAALFLVTGVLLDRTLAAVPFATQRWIGFFTLVFPAVIGVVLALVGLRRPRDNRFAALIGLLLNALFGVFFTLVLLIAG
jgi:hypothetical protein